MLICHILLIPILINFVTIKFEGIGSRDGYEFTGWSDVTSTYTSSGTSTFAMGSSNVTLYSNLEQNLYRNKSTD